MGKMHLLTAIDRTTCWFEAILVADILAALLYSGVI
jgi:hypothetical protein